MAKAGSARASVKVGGVVATGAGAVAVAAVVVGEMANAAKERHVKPRASRVRHASSMALREDQLPDMPNRAAHAARANRPLVSRVKATAAQVAEIRDESVARDVAIAVVTVVAMAELRAILKWAAKVEAKAVVTVAVAVRVSQGATNPLALRQSAMWPRPWAHRAFFP